MRLNVIAINCISNKMGGFVTNSIVDENVAVLLEKFVVESEFVVCWNDVTSATALQIEADGWKGERNAVDILGFRVNFFDSFDRFRLQFCHAFRLAPCSAKGREKIKNL